MKPKKFTFLLSAALLMGGVNSAFASHEVSELGEGDFLLKNVATGKYLCPGNNWGTRASLSQQGMLVTLAKSGDGYTISTKPYYGSNRYVTDNGYLDTVSPTTWTISLAENSTDSYIISSNNKHLAWDGSSTIVNVVDPTSNSNEQWQIIKVTTDGASVDKPVEMSYLIKNATGDQCGDNLKSWFNPWTFVNAGGAGGQIDDSNRNMEIFNNTGSAIQTITGLPNGKYKLTCKGYYRAGDNDPAIKAHKNGTEEINAYFVANDKKVALHSIFDAAGKNDAGSIDTEWGKIPNWSKEAAKYFEDKQDLYTNTISDVVVTDGTIKFGITKDKTITNDWAIFDDFHLYYLGTVEDAVLLEQAKNDFKELQKEGHDLLVADDYSNIKGSEKAALSKAIENKDVTLSNIADLKQAYNDAKTAFVNAKSTYDEVAFQISNAKVMGADVTKFEEAFNNEKATVESLKATLNDLNVAQFEYLTNKSNNYTNITSSRLPSDKWDKSNINELSSQHWDGSSTSTYFEGQITGKWGAPLKDNVFMKQTNVKLPKGTYTFKFFCRNTDKSSASATVNVTDGNSYSVNFPVKYDNGKGIDTDGKANFSEGGTYANGNKGRGWEWRYLSFTLDKDASVDFSIQASSKDGYQYPGWGKMELFAIAQNETLDETQNYENTESKIANVTLNRKLNATNWNTVVFPFDLSDAQVKAAFGDEAKVAEYTGSEKSGEVITLNFKDVTDGIKANTPYMLKASKVNEEHSYTFDGVVLEPAAGLKSVEDAANHINFVGNYTADKTLDANTYFISNNTFYRANGNEKMGAYRATFTAPAGSTSAKTLAVSFDGGEVTGIQEINNSAAKAASYDVYNLSGILVKKNATDLNGLAKGVYIVNGKKYIAE